MYWYITIDAISWNFLIKLTLTYILILCQAYLSDTIFCITYIRVLLLILLVVIREYARHVLTFE